MDKLKYDSGKPRLALVPPAAIKAIGTIMTFGLTKYDEGSWKNVEPWRYRDALMRHLCEYLNEPYGVDEESGYPHLWHVIINAAFLCELEEDNLTQKDYQPVTMMFGDGKVQVEFKKGFGDNVDISELLNKVEKQKVCKGSEYLDPLLGL